MEKMEKGLSELMFFAQEIVTAKVKKQFKANPQYSYNQSVSLKHIKYSLAKI